MLSCRAFATSFGTLTGKLDATLPLLPRALLPLAGSFIGEGDFDDGTRVTCLSRSIASRVGRRLRPGATAVSRSARGGDVGWCGWSSCGFLTARGDDWGLFSAGELSNEGMVQEPKNDESGVYHLGPRENITHP
jgi:hypothetical protein